MAESLYQNNNADALSQAHQDELLLQMQMEALGIRRREKILTDEFPEKQICIPTSDIERRINIAGSKENKLARVSIRKLTAWNNAWQNLEKDGTAEDVIEVNEGLGQTHRQRLQEDDRVRDYTGEPPHRGGYFSSGRGGRSGQTGGRGGGASGRGSGRKASKEQTLPVTRSRVVKGRSGLVEPVKIRQAAKKSQDFSASKPRREVVAKLSGNIEVSASIKRQSVAYGGLLASPVAFMGHMLSSSLKRAASKQQLAGTTEQKAKASVAKLASTPVATEIAQPSVAPTITKTISDKRKDGVPARVATISDLRVPGESNGTSIAEKTMKESNPSKVKSTESSVTRNHSATSSISKSSFTTSKTSQSVDLMDLEVGEESAAQPVISFTHVPKEKTSCDEGKQLPRDPSLQALLARFSQGLEDSGRLKAGQLDALKAVFKEDETQPTVEPDLTGAAQSSPDKPKALSDRRESQWTTYTQSELTALRPRSENSLKQNVELPTTQRKPKKPVRSLAKQMEEKREAVIGEHIYKNRWRLNPTALAKDMANLSLEDKESDTVDVNKDTARGYATKNPFSPTKARTGAYTKFDPGAALLAQYGQVTTAANAELPAAKPVRDDGENGFTIRDAARVLADETSTSSSAKANVPAQSSSSNRNVYVPCGAPSVPWTIKSDQTENKPPTAPRAKRAVRATSGPQLPAFLQGLKSTDAGAAVRAQCGVKPSLMTVTSDKTENQAPTASRAKRAVRPASGPQLPAFLQGLKSTDAGAAVHAQYDSSHAPALFSYENSAPASDDSPPPVRRSRLNESGLIGMAARARDAGAAVRVQDGSGNAPTVASNGTPAPAPDDTPPPVRRSRLNESGFIGMAARAKKGQDPLEKVRQLGL